MRFRRGSPARSGAVLSGAVRSGARGPARAGAAERAGSAIRTAPATSSGHGPPVPAAPGPASPARAAESGTSVPHPRPVRTSRAGTVLSASTAVLPLKRHKVFGAVLVPVQNGSVLCVRTWGNEKTITSTFVSPRPLSSKGPPWEKKGRRAGVAVPATFTLGDVSARRHRPCSHCLGTSQTCEEEEGRKKKRYCGDTAGEGSPHYLNPSVSSH